MRVVFVGALNENKGVLRALEILNRVRSSGVRIKVDIVGDGPQRHTLEQAIQAADWGPDLVVHGWLPKGAIGQIYGQSHLILMTSKTEGWPKVLSEAMAYGVVPVASAISCIPDWLKEFGCGEKIDSADYNGFANSILSFVRDLDRLKAHSAKAIAAAERFTYDNYIIAVQKLLQLKS
jgi:glycosyltransferase involved in cell wall biosynthesis